MRMYGRSSAALSPTANRGRASLAALLDIGADELLGVLLEDLVDLVEDRVHVVGQLLVALPYLVDRGSLVLLGLLGTPRRLPLASGVLVRCHLLVPPSVPGVTPRQLQRYRRPRQARPILERGIGFLWAKTSRSVNPLL